MFILSTPRGRQEFEIQFVCNLQPPSRGRNYEYTDGDFLEDHVNDENSVSSLKKRKKFIFWVSREDGYAVKNLLAK